MFMGGSQEIYGLPTPQQKAYDVCEHCPAAVFPLLQSRGTQNSPQYACDVDLRLSGASAAQGDSALAMETLAGITRKLAVDFFSVQGRPGINFWSGDACLCQHTTTMTQI